MGNVQNMLDLAIEALNKEQYPFTVYTIDNKLVAEWRWKDGTLLGNKSISHEIANFKYIVILNEDCTFYGYDTYGSSTAKGDIGHMGMQTSFGIGHMPMYHKEIAFGRKAGEPGIKLQSWTFSTKQIHGPIKQFFEDNGWEYKEPNMCYVKAGINSGVTLPMFSTRFSMALIFGFFFLMWAVTITGCELFYLILDPVFEYSTQVRNILHISEFVSIAGLICTIVIYKITGKKQH